MQRQIKSSLAALAVTLLAAILLLTGCNVTVHDKEKGKENVDISTPLGGLKVRTEVDPRETGLSVYPNSRLAPQKNGKGDSQKANVNISTPFFGIKVIALDYQTDDPAGKVLDFYKNDMARYGKVVQCKASGGSQHAEANNGKLSLECEKAGDNDTGIELKAGEGSSQHIVSIKRQDKGTEFGLVYIQVRGKAETM